MQTGATKTASKQKIQKSAKVQKLEQNKQVITAKQKNNRTCSQIGRHQIIKPATQPPRKHQIASLLTVVKQSMSHEP